MQRSCRRLIIVESSLARTCQRSRLKRDGNSGSTSVEVIRGGPGVGRHQNIEGWP
ncbi:hypothetical protein DPMN_096307 [Dreissena polymorpha]|uniref:Uncharacterized protein n=1 Tax=Dreissena polymorpha TaxID=45954 RepID=A0A9D4L831_DREPO|nr:hypothetical protein DPMN_096307 [Dreissena polymorpha]